MCVCAWAVQARARDQEHPQPCPRRPPDTAEKPRRRGEDDPPERPRSAIGKQQQRCRACAAGARGRSGEMQQGDAEARRRSPAR